MKPILGKPMILHQIDRIGRSRLIDKVILATSDNYTDDDLANACVENGTSVFRGSLDDVLDRFYQSALIEEPDHVIRLTGDCPLADPEIIDRVILHHLTGGFDYTSNVRPPTFPDGLDVEAFRVQKLIDAWKNADEAFDREHVTPWIHRQTDCLLGNLENATDMCALRWTVDEPDDLVFVRQVFEGIYPKNQTFGMTEILEFINRNPEIQKINQRFVRKFQEFTRSRVLEQLSQFMAVSGDVSDWGVDELLFELPDKYRLSFSIRERILSGYVVMSRKSANRVCIHQFMVHPAKRNLGFGADMLEEAVRRTAGESLSLKVSITNLGAIRFFERHGFEKKRTESQYHLMHRKC